MRKKLFGPILGGALLLSAGVGCCVDKYNRNTITTISQDDISAYAGQVVCVRSTQPVHGLGDGVTDSDERTSVGTGFVYRRVNGWTYVLTARHVGTFEPSFQINDGVPRLWVANGNGRYDIVDDVFDSKIGDDAPMEKYYEDEKHDFLAFRTRSELPYVPARRFVGDERMGDETAVLGYIFGRLKVLSMGVLAGVDDGAPILDNRIVQGFSGGPFFIKDKDGWALAGFMTSVFSYDNSSPTGFSRGVWLRDVIGGLEMKLNDELVKGAGGG